MRVPERGKIYSVNEGNSKHFHDKTAKYIEKVKATGYSARYVGSMVADVHRTLLYGGIFMYPVDKKSPNGKLRLLYECFPMAYIMEQAGGKAITSDGGRILDIVPSKIHDRAGIILGSASDVDDYASI